MKKLKDILKEAMNPTMGAVYSNPYATAFKNESEESVEEEFTSEQRDVFLAAVKEYKKFGESVYRTKGLEEVCKSIKNLVEVANKITIKETGDWFDGVTVSRHMKRMNESYKVFEKTLSEVATLQQRMESSYDEIGEVLSKYYEICNGDDELEEGNEFGAARAKAIAAGNDSFEVDGKEYPLKDVDNDDKENAKEFANESNKKRKTMKLTDLLKKSIKEGSRNVWKSNDILYVDSDFVNASQGKIKNSELKHLGMGDFVLKTPTGEITFFRTNEKFKNQSGRAHRMKDTTSGKLVNQLIKLMSAKIQNESVNESTVTEVYDGPMTIRHDGEKLKIGAKIKVEDEKGKSQLAKVVKYSGNDMYIVKPIKENFSSDDVATIKKIVTKQKDLVGLTPHLKKAGFRDVDFIMIDSVPPHIRIKKGNKTFIITNKKYADKPDFVVGDIAGGIDESVISEAKKVNPASKKFLKGMKKIKINGLGGYMPGTDYVYVDGKQLWFVDYEGDHMELVNKDTIKQLQKLHGSSLGESVNEAVKYDIGMAKKGNGITIYNKAEEVKGDFKTIAHIDNKGNVKFFDKKLPSNIKKVIELEAGKLKEAITEHNTKGTNMIKLKNLLKESFGLGELPSAKLMKMKMTLSELEESEKMDSTLNEGFATWEMTFEPMTIGGVKLDPKTKYRVKARSTMEAIKKASKEAGLKGDDWMVTQTKSLKKVG